MAASARTKKKWVRLTFLSFNNSLASQEGMILLIRTPVLRRLVSIRYRLPLFTSSCLSRQTASTRDKPDQRCSCIRAFTRMRFSGTDLLAAANAFDDFDVLLLSERINYEVLISDFYGGELYGRILADHSRIGRITKKVTHSTLIIAEGEFA